MEGEVVSSHLRIKFSLTLHEAEADLGSSLPIISRFRAIEGLINTITEDSSTMAGQLYKLMDVLSDCIIYARERRKEAASRKIIFFFRGWSERNIRRRVDEIENELKVIGRRDENVTGKLKIQKTTYPDAPNPSQLVGFESQVNEFQDLLMPCNEEDEEEKGQLFKAIGIVGRCGCGKTTLTQAVFASPKIKECFSPMIWVCLSDILLDNERTDPRVKILNQILRETGEDASDLEYGDYSVVKLLEKLQLRLMGKRYLIVLDNAWRMDEWFADLGCRGQPPAESFAHGLPKGSGGAVIVTSRGEGVIRRMVGEEDYVIRPQLSDETCWKIFSDAVREQGKISPDDPMLIEMEASITKSCEGLPLAAKTLANLIPNLLVEKS